MNTKEVMYKTSQSQTLAKLFAMIKKSNEGISDTGASGKLMSIIKYSDSMKIKIEANRVGLFGSIKDF